MSWNADAKSWERRPAAIRAETALLRRCAEAVTVHLGNDR